MGKRILIALPKDVYVNLKNLKKDVETDVSKWANKDVKITMPKFINALVLKHSEIAKFLPFNKQAVALLAKKKRGVYDL
jgi:hypothetical protein